jgi:heme/copper-type cytochrome/quinol oxidase subunit 3
MNEKIKNFYEEYVKLKNKDRLIAKRTLFNMKGKRSKFNLVTASPWPVFSAMSALVFVIGFLFWMHERILFLLLFGVFLFIVSIVFWFRDVIREGLYIGSHTKLMIKCFKMGFLLFILSEIMLFFGFFWSYLHYSLVPSAFIGGVWPPAGFVVYLISEDIMSSESVFKEPLSELYDLSFLYLNLFSHGSLVNPYKIPLLNTVILLTSGATLTLSHHCLKREDFKMSAYTLCLTLFLGLYFFFLQVVEYSVSGFSINDGVYGSIFYLLTGFHGFHVVIGITILSVCLVRLLNVHFSANNHFAFEAGIWYWHFVDVVWIILYLMVYFWPTAGFFISKGKFNFNLSSELVTLDVPIESLNFPEFDVYTNLNNNLELKFELIKKSLVRFDHRLNDINGEIYMSPGEYESFVLPSPNEEEDEKCRYMFKNFEEFFKYTTSSSFKRTKDSDEILKFVGQLDEFKKTRDLRFRLYLRLLDEWSETFLADKKIMLQLWHIYNLNTDWKSADYIVDRELFYEDQLPVYYFLYMIERIVPGGIDLERELPDIGPLPDADGVDIKVAQGITFAVEAMCEQIIKDSINNELLSISNKRTFILLEMFHFFLENEKKPIDSNKLLEIIRLSRITKEELFYNYETFVDKEKRILNEMGEKEVLDILAANVEFEEIQEIWNFISYLNNLDFEVLFSDPGFDNIPEGLFADIFEYEEDNGDNGDDSGDNGGVLLSPMEETRNYIWGFINGIKKNFNSLTILCDNLKSNLDTKNSLFVQLSKKSFVDMIMGFQVSSGKCYFYSPDPELGEKLLEIFRPWFKEYFFSKDLKWCARELDCIEKELWKISQLEIFSDLASKYDKIVGEEPEVEEFGEIMIDAYFRMGLDLEDFKASPSEPSAAGFVFMLQYIKDSPTIEHTKVVRFLRIARFLLDSKLPEADSFSSRYFPSKWYIKLDFLGIPYLEDGKEKSKRVCEAFKGFASPIMADLVQNGARVCFFESHLLNLLEKWKSLKKFDSIDYESALKLIFTNVDGRIDEEGFKRWRIVLENFAKKLTNSRFFDINFYFNYIFEDYSILRKRLSTGEIKEVLKYKVPVGYVDYTPTLVSMLDSIRWKEDEGVLNMVDFISVLGNVFLDGFSLNDATSYLTVRELFSILEFIFFSGEYEVSKIDKTKLENILRGLVKSH